MKYQKIINLLDKTPNQRIKPERIKRKKNNSQINFETLC